MGETAVVEPPIIVERRDFIAIVTLNRPAKANAIDAAMLRALNALELDLAADPDVRVIVVTGAGHHFCGGVDLVAAAAESPWGPEAHIGFDLVPQPLIAAVNGSAMGGGCEIALACDFRVMSSEATIGLPEIQFGELPFGGGTARLAGVVGVPWAKRMIMTGQPLDASTALRIGLVDEVVEPAAVLASALGLAQRLAELAPYAVQAAKRLVDRSATGNLAAALARERSTVLSMATDEQRAAARRDAARRSPVYARMFPS